MGGSGLMSVWIRVALIVALGVSMSASAEAKHLSYGWQPVQGVDLFYREGGPSTGPTIVLLHGSPASSIQYQEMMERLASDGYHVIAMDYPSFGYSAAPSTKTYAYTFGHLAETVGEFLRLRHIDRYALYMQDYGVPVGFRLIEEHPEQVTAVMVQNGVIHLDGFPTAQDPDGELRRHWRERNPQIDDRRRDYAAKLAFPGPQGWSEDSLMSPDAILLMKASEQRPGVIGARNDLWFDYGRNVERYPRWQVLLRDLKAPTLVVWGSRDDFFTVPGAVAYLRDAPGAEVHILDTVHFATLEAPDAVGDVVTAFLSKHSSELRSAATPTTSGAPTN